MMDCDFAHMSMGDFMRNLEQEAYEQAIPLKGIFELTPRCNMNCQMCYIHLQPDQIPAVGRELTAKEWISIGQAARDAGMVELTLTGGEALVRPDFREIYEAFSEMGFLIQLYTNGYGLNEKVMEWLKERPPYSIRFTMYGFSDETYEKVCGVKHGFTRVIQAMNLVRRSGIPMYMVATITKDNEQDFPSIEAFARENRLPFTYTTTLIKPVRGAVADVERYQVERRLPPPEVLEEMRRPENRKKPHKKHENLLEVCGNYRKGFWITWNGKMQLCTFLTEPGEPVLEYGFAESWNRLLEDVQKLRQPDKCLDCKYEGYCRRCYGDLYAASGRCDVAAESCCEHARLMYEIYETE